MTEPEYQRREVIGIHLDDDPDLEDKEKHGLTLTTDGKLRVDDPTTQAAIGAINDLLTHADYGLEALADDIEGNYEVLTDPGHGLNAILGVITDSVIGDYLADAGFGLAALEAFLGAIPTTPELEAAALTRYTAIIAAIASIPDAPSAATIWAYATRRLTNLSDERAAKIDNLDAKISDIPIYVNASSERGPFTTSYAKYKEVQCYVDLSGVVSVFFQLKGSATTFAYGRVYKNGAGIGTTRSIKSDKYTGFGEVFTDEFVTDDLIQLYARAATSGYGRVQNFTISRTLVILAD